MQRFDAIGNVFIAGWWKVAELFAKIFEYRERDDGRSIIFHVQFIAERGLEQNEEILPFIAR